MLAAYEAPETVMEDGCRVDVAVHALSKAAVDLDLVEREVLQGRQ